MTRRLTLLSLLALSIAATPALADRLSRLAGDEATNSFFIEGGGPGLLYSINYERLIERDFGVRIGMSYVSYSGTVSGGGSSSSASAGILAVPVTVSYLGLRGGNHVLELGAGATGVYATGAASGNGLAASGSGMTALGTVLIGYRRQPVDGGFMFRIGMEALVGKGLALSNPDPNSFGVLPWMYLSLGFSL